LVGAEVLTVDTTFSLVISRRFSVPTNATIFTDYCVKISGVNLSWTPGEFCTYPYNYTHRLRLEKLLYLELSRSPNGFLKPFLDPGGGFTSETAERLFHN
jgi:hypothetical protein